MAATRLNVSERLVLLVTLAAVLSVLGFLIAGATVTTPALSLPRNALIPRGEIPFMQTVKELGANGGGFFTARHPQTPTWIIISLVVGFGSLWFVSAVALLRARLRTVHPEQVISPEGQ